MEAARGGLPITRRQGLSLGWGKGFLRFMLGSQDRAEMRVRREPLGRGRAVPGLTHEEEREATPSSPTCTSPTSGASAL